MKKLLYIIPLILLLVLLAACGAPEETTARNDSTTVITTAQTTTCTSGPLKTMADYEYRENIYGGITIEKYIGEATNVVIPSQIDGKPVSEVAVFSFSQSQVECVTIPKSVSVVYDSSFQDCDTLKKVIFEGDAPEEYIYYPYFSYRNDYTVYYNKDVCGFSAPRWYGFESRVIGEEDDINEYVYQNFKYTVDLDGNITILGYIGNETNLVIPDKIDGKTVVSIGFAAFFDNDELISVTIPSTVLNIAPQAFACCKSLANVNLTFGLVAVGDYSFALCDKLSNINIPNSLETISSHAFYYCKSLKSITIPKAVSVIGDGSFMYSGLENVTFEEGIKEISGNNAFGGVEISELVIPASVKKISERAFANCEYLKIVRFNEGLESIGSGAFSNTAIVNIVIPETVKDMTEEAFYYCNALEKVMFEGDAPDYEAKVKPTYTAGVTQNYIVCYHADAKGFTSPEWCGYETEIW